MNGAERLWHYTVLPHYQNIVKEGRIRVATDYITDTEQPAVWLSSNPSFEETARKSIIDSETGERYEDLSRDELHAKGVPPVRVMVDSEAVRAHRWREDKTLLGMTTQYAEALEQTGVRVGANPDEWWFVLEEVPLSACVLAEYWDGVAWKEFAHRVD